MTTEMTLAARCDFFELTDDEIDGVAGGLVPLLVVFGTIVLAEVTAIVLKEAIDHNIANTIAGIGGCIQDHMPAKKMN